MNWTDIEDIAISLHKHYPDIDPLSLSFTRLRKMVLELDGFDPEGRDCNEKILEVIQMAWLDEIS
ncbi:MULTISPECIES: Fe-S cluster assembly protein IscX [Candidatus Ichthyocystis]|uniref:FeS assembly protein n=1 Tax=Candidatus Ichthyocystis hellenicum TaxID=1561003 RepID=A0A0S4M1Q1_9BURK|nr:MULTISPECIES: Fe-S cluster assembly protein IscX [Ichthyocystis]CUT17614.1 FeS assembly protein [Candidatus Ichthyocystis hellenicum]